MYHIQRQSFYVDKRQVKVLFYCFTSLGLLYLLFERFNFHILLKHQNRDTNACLGKLELALKHSCGSTSTAYKGDR